MKQPKWYDKCFLFGAGAEICYGLSGGGNFAQIVIGDSSTIGDKTNDMNWAIKEYYRGRSKEWYPRYCQYTFKKEHLFNAAIKKKFLDEEVEVRNKKGFDDFLTKQVEVLKSQKTKIIDNHTSYMGILDEKFHTLISPKYLGPSKFWGVVGCYTRAYLLLTGEMMRKVEGRGPSKKDYLDMLENPINHYKKWRYISPVNDSYYDVLKEYKEKTKDKNFSIVTTNYTPICENATEIQDIAYVNGRLNWFESPYELKVYDINKDNERDKNDVRFPYIFVQSGVKPIIEEKQINEYAKMMDYFRNTNTIIIVGYRINADDNHINSFLRSAVCSGKKIVYFNHNNSLSREQIYKRLRLSESSEYTIDIVEVNNENCFSKFEEILYAN